MAKRKRYPLGVFLKQFSTEAQCREYLADMRWKEGYVCPKCGCRHAYLLSNGRYQCTQCRHQVSVTAGTVLHKTHTPLTQWFLAFYLVCQDKRGILWSVIVNIVGLRFQRAEIKAFFHISPLSSQLTRLYDINPNTDIPHFRIRNAFIKPLGLFIRSCQSD